MEISATSITELSLAVASVLGALALCLVKCIAQTEQSRCTKLDCLCCHLERDTTEPVEVVTEATAQPDATA
jgi:hypothetical protein